MDPIRAAKVRMLYSIMRKESGFDPHDLSYADAQGLLQMIPPTTLRVAKELGLPYDAGKLYEPDYNVRTGSWYIGHLLAKFNVSIAFGAAENARALVHLDRSGDNDVPKQHLART